jgi:starvation-inducible DNA-binding protein
MYYTKIDLDEQQRFGVVAALQSRLSDALDLAAQLKQAHWNVKGPNFQQLHELFDQLNASTVAHTDLLGERIVTLGDVADGRIQRTVRDTLLYEYPVGARSGRQHLEAICSALAAFARSIRSDIDLATDLGDAGTADLFTEISREADKNLWFVEAHLEG